MKFSNIKYGMFAAILALGITSCEDFLDRPTEDSYTIIKQMISALQV